MSACDSRDGGDTDSGSTDLGTDTYLPPIDSGSHIDAGGTDDGSVADMGPVDLTDVDLGEPCGFRYCTGTTYCCATECSLCLDRSRVCGSNPCLGVDAGPPPPLPDGGIRDAGPPRDGGCPLMCPSGTSCMVCFGAPECVSVGC